MMTLGEKIRKLRMKRGLTQSELAEQLAIEQSFMSYLENDKSVPNVGVFNKLLDVFSITSSNLLSDIDKIYIQKYLGHIPLVAEQQLQAKSPSGLTIVYNLYAVSAVSLLIIGIILLLIGGYGLIVSNMQFQYSSKGYYKTFNLDWVKEENRLNSADYLGQVFVASESSEENLPRVYVLKNKLPQYTVANKYFMIIGFVLAVTAVFLLLFERRLRELWQFHG